VAGLGLVHSLYRAHRGVVPATAWHLVPEITTTDATKRPGVRRHFFFT